jgi:phosphatidylinositol alpha-mannosyltransferase
VKRHASHLAQAMRSHGDEVVIAGPLRRGLPGRDTAGFGGVVNIPANGAANYMALLTPPWSVADFFRTRRFDVIHIHEPMVPMLAWYAHWFTNGAARVATFHMYAETEGSPSSAARGLLARVLFPSLHGAIAVSPAAADYASRFWRRPLAVIPNGVSTTLFHPPRVESARAAESPLRLLFVGTWRDRRKGLPVLLDAFRQLRREGLAVVLDVIGEGTPDQQQRAIEGVTFHGVVPSESALTEHYRRCDLFVAPSTGQESFGIVLVEAMASGRAIVCSDIRGYRDVVDPRGAVLVPPRDAVALARAIASLASAPERRTEMGIRNRRLASAYDWTSIARQVRDVYLESIAALRGEPLASPRVR